MELVGKFIWLYLVETHFDGYMFFVIIVDCLRNWEDDSSCKVTNLAVVVEIDFYRFLLARHRTYSCLDWIVVDLRPLVKVVVSNVVKLNSYNNFYNFGSNIHFFLSSHCEALQDTLRSHASHVLFPKGIINPERNVLGVLSIKMYFQTVCFFCNIGNVNVTIKKF